MPERDWPEVAQVLEQLEGKLFVEAQPYDHSGNAAGFPDMCI